ncbi:hypothetical protein [Streptomyces candidus]|uniref:Uncharacterized protein n=1 Tax=Streptomyces candidus TaxID=67283 RepID=A0A7X0HK00_9ACTN|nr:hypothetical protein [Streptomyces candidus]MBB6438903.1 hypothetical protein [Streptomyces candidus]GHH52526.1 hypothetical protein GCM10018773_52670 [Streptomyces candidus]
MSSNVLTLYAGPAGADGQGQAQVANMVSFSNASGPAPSAVYVERDLPPGGTPAYLAARRAGVRSFALWADDRRRERVATVTTLSADGGVAKFQVLGAHGEFIGTLTREKAFRGRALRTRWTVHQSGGWEAVGLKGRIVWWWMWWLLLPFMTAVLVMSVFDSVPGNEGGLARAPRRIRWRANGQVPLEFRSKGDKLHVYAPGVDWRLAAAMIALLRSFHVGAWDSVKK